MSHGRHAFARRSLGAIVAFLLAASAVVAVAWRSAHGERNAVERDFGKRLAAEAGEAAARPHEDLGAAIVRDGRFVAPPEPRPLTRLGDSAGRDPVGDQQLADAAALELNPAKAAEAERALRELASGDAGLGRDAAVVRLARFRLAAFLRRAGRDEAAAVARAEFLADVADDADRDGVDGVDGVDDDARGSAEALLARIDAGERGDRLREDLLLALGTGDDLVVVPMLRAAGAGDAAIARRREALEQIVRLRPLASRGAFPPTRLDDGSLAVAVAAPDGPDISNFPDMIVPPLFAIATASAAEVDTETRRRLRLQWLALAGLLGGGALLLFFTLRAVRRESEAAAARSAFVARVSHDLRTPLSVIRMYAETLAQGRATDPEQVREFAGVAAREAERLSDLVARVLDFSRASLVASKDERMLPRAPVDVGELLQELADQQKGAIAAAGMQLGLVVNGAPLRVHGDREGLRAALANLIENAIRHAASGARVEIAAAANRGEVEVRVSDRGPGLPGGLESRIFEPFVRGPQARPGGSGLGLALVREVAAAHRGRVSAANRDGGGATFVLALPRAPEAAT